MAASPGDPEHVRLPCSVRGTPHVRVELPEEALTTGHIRAERPPGPARQPTVTREMSGWTSRQISVDPEV